MKHKLIKTDNYLLVVDDSEIKEGDYTYHHIKGIYTAVVDGGYTNQKKIIAHLPLNDSPVLGGVPLLPPLEQEDDVKMMAEIRFIGSNDDTNYNLRFGFIEGYNKAKEIYKFTEEDMRKMYEEGLYGGMETTYEEKLKSLSQPKMPTHFESTGVIETYEGDYNPVMLGKYIYEGGEQ